MLKDGYNDLWPTKVFVGKIEDQELLGSIIQETFLISDGPLGKRIDGDNIFKGDNEIFDSFKTKIVLPSFEEYLNRVVGTSLSNYPKFELNGWLTGRSHGYGMPMHNHSGSQLSAVFYLMAEEEAGGKIIFVDPRSNANRGYDSFFRKEFDNIEHVPKAGEFLIFPSFLYHWVSYYHSKMRIAIPVDIFMGPHISTM